MGWRPYKADSQEKLHFGMYVTDSIVIGDDGDNPTYIGEAMLSGASSDEFTLLDSATGLVRNDSDRTITMQGTVSYQILQGAGGVAGIKFWSERSSDDGVTFTENLLSLRTGVIRNNGDDSQSKTSAVMDWAPGESIRWAFYKDSGGSVTFTAPTDTVNDGNAVSGVSFFWQLNEV